MKRFLTPRKALVLLAMSLCMHGPGFARLPGDAQPVAIEAQGTPRMGERMGSLERELGTLREQATTQRHALERLRSEPQPLPWALAAMLVALVVLVASDGGGRAGAGRQPAPAQPTPPMDTRSEAAPHGYRARASTVARRAAGIHAPSLAEVLQQCRFLAALGAVDRAVEVLRAHIEQGDAPASAWIELHALCVRAGDEELAADIALECRARFGADAAEHLHSPVA